MVYSGEMQNSLISFQTDKLAASQRIPFNQALEYTYSEFENGDLNRALFQAEQLLTQAPPAVATLWLKACILDGLSAEPSLRLQICEQALTLEPWHPNFSLMKAHVLRLQGNQQMAIEWIKDVVTHHPKFPDLYVEMGLSYKEKGEKSLAERSFRRALDCNSQHAAAWFNLIEITQFTRDDLQKMLATSRRKKLLTRERVHLYFAIAAYWRQEGDIDKEFLWLHKANEQQKKEQVYDSPANSRLIDEHIQRFPASYFSKTHVVVNPKSAPRPIFIVGMPRTGSTLLEQMLSSHTGVDATGECCDLELCLRRYANMPIGKGDQPSMVPEVNKADFGSIKEAYLELIRKRVSSPVFTDKSLDNYRVIGLLKLLFPDARILHITRNPLDSMLSCYQRSFARLPFTNDLTELAEYYVNYRRLMDHWKSAFDDCCLDIRYEDLVRNTRPEVEKILSYCELDWQDQVLEFAENKNAVKTASLMQVREGIYQRSLSGWKKYKKQLLPAIKVLDSAGMLDTGG